MAVSDLGVSIGVFAQVIGCHRFAKTSHIVERVEEPVGVSSEAVVVLLFEDLLSIEVGHTLTTNGSCEDILMSINKRVDTCFSQSIDEIFDLIKISLVVLASFSLDGFPHDTKSHLIDSPIFKILNITGIKRGIWGEISITRNERVHLIDNINAMENEMTTLGIPKESIAGVDVDARLRKSGSC